MFTKADWDGLKADFSSTDWKLLFQDIDPEGSVHNFCNYIETCCIRRIPRRVISTRVCSHPWLDAECIAAVQAKCAAAWSDEFRTKELECERILTKAFVSYRQSLTERILSLPRSSKQWWKYNKELLNRPTNASSISPLKNSDGTWVTDPTEKAALLAAQFQRKSVLPAPVGVTCALNLCTDKNNQLNIKYGAGTFAILTNTATREVQTRIRCRVLLKIMSELNPRQNQWTRWITCQDFQGVPRSAGCCYCNVSSLRATTQILALGLAAPPHPSIVQEGFSQHAWELQRRPFDQCAVKNS